MKTLSHAEFKAEMFSDDRGPLITLTQAVDGYCEPMEVTMHPWQLRTVLEQFDVIAADNDAAKMIATLERRLLLLRDRIGFLQNYLATRSDHKHADPSFEITYATATADIADEFCHGHDNESMPVRSGPLQSAPVAPVQTAVQASLL